MAINLKGDTVEVFKFEDTGLVALCREVVDYVGSRGAYEDNVDFTTARYVNENGMHKVVFNRRKD